MTAHQIEPTVDRGPRALVEQLSNQLRARGLEFSIACIDIDTDRHACGRRAAKQALEHLGEDPDALVYDGTRPFVRGERAAVSITHEASIAVAIAARVSRLGIDVCRNDSRLPVLAGRFLVAEQAVVANTAELSICFAAKEAALKALGVGLVDGGVLDGTAVAIVSLDPPRLSNSELHLVVAADAEHALAVVYALA